jgi:small subunit ribosomal protein S16
MSVSLRLSRGGSKKRPYYKVVVSNSRSPRDGKYLEQVGTYNPLLAKDDENRVRLVEDRIRYWLGVGAQPTDRVARMLDKAGIKERVATNNPQKAEPGQKAKDRAEDKLKKAAEAEEAKAAAAAAPAEEAAAEETPAEEAAVEEAAAEEAAAPEEEASSEEAAPEAEAAPAEEAAADVNEATPNGDAGDDPEAVSGESAQEPAEGADEKTEG